jgi:hypothetical protein
MAGDYFTTRWGEEMRGVFRHHDIDISPMVFEQAQDAECLKGGNTTGNRQDRLDAMQ